MKKFKVKALFYFKDNLAKKHREKNEEFECDEERYKFLKDNNAVELIDEIVDEILTDNKIDEMIDEIVDEVVDKVVERPKKSKKKKSGK